MPKARTDAEPSVFTPEPVVEGEEPSAGISSSPSESKPEKSGSTPQATEESSPSPAPKTESRSARGRQDQESSSTARSTGGDTPKTGSSPRGQQTSSGKDSKK